MKKKAYEKPELKGEKLFQATAGQSCCRDTTTVCSTDMQSGGGKTTQTKFTS